jgi:hypothetical protein
MLALGLAACGTPQAPHARTLDERFPSDERSTDANSSGASSGALPSRTVYGAEEGRATILELYQKLVEERDALRATASARDAELERLRAAVDASMRETAEANARASTFERDLATARNDLFDLAARLTIAQIRRLQAERLLLERGIDPAEARAARDTALTPP